MYAYGKADRVCCRSKSAPNRTKACGNKVGCLMQEVDVREKVLVHGAGSFVVVVPDWLIWRLLVKRA
ncbi:hypothetical protein IQ06DRAFT_102503 [Phaeosphaeriaceae sp. SRC1lsM3a]|nr:hypothetical protein IQ06DRAFT_102503 [Stagonospora sp. SRC1lsM3a]